MDQHSRTRSPWSVRRYLSLIAVTAVLAVVGGCWYGFAFSAERARTEALTELGFQADRAAESVTDSLEVSRETVRGVASQPGLEAVFAAGDNGCTLTAGAVGAFRSVRLDMVSAEGTTGCSSGTAPRGPCVVSGTLADSVVSTAVVRPIAGLLDGCRW